MASFVFNNIKSQLALGTFSFKVNDGQFRLALLTSGIFDNNNVTYSGATKWSEIKSFEINQSSNSTYNSNQYSQKIIYNVGTGVVTDNGTAECDDGLPDVKVYANDVVYPVSTIDADCAVIIKTSNTTGDIDDDDVPVLALDIRNNGKTISSNNGTFSIRLNSDSGGFLTIK